MFKGICTLSRILRICNDIFASVLKTEFCISESLNLVSLHLCIFRNACEVVFKKYGESFCVELRFELSSFIIIKSSFWNPSINRIYVTTFQGLYIHS